MTSEVSENIPIPTVTTAHWIQCAKLWQENNDWSNAKRCLNHALDKALTKRHWLMVANVSLLLNDKKSLKLCYQAMKSLASSVEDSILLAQCGSVLGMDFKSHLINAGESCQMTMDWLALARAYHELGDDNQGKWHIRQAARYADNDSYDWYFVAQAYIDQGMKLEGGYALDAAKEFLVHTKPWRQCTLLLKLAKCYITIGNKDSAEHCVSVAVEKAKDTPDFQVISDWIRCAEAFYGLLKNETAALDCMAKAVSFALDSSIPCEQLRRCVKGYWRIGEKDLALTQARKSEILALQQTPLMHATNLIECAASFQILEDNMSVIRLLEQAEQVIPTSGEYSAFHNWINCAERYLSLGAEMKVLKCLAESELAAKKSSQPCRYLCEVVDFYLRLGREDAARQCLKTAVTQIRAPYDPCLDWLCCVKRYFSLSDEQHARDCLLNAEKEAVAQSDWHLCKEHYQELGDTESVKRCQKMKSTVKETDETDRAIIQHDTDVEFAFDPNFKYRMIAALYESYPKLQISGEVAFRLIDNGDNNAVEFTWLLDRKQSDLLKGTDYQESVELLIELIVNNREKYGIQPNKKGTLVIRESQFDFKWD